MKSIHLAQQHFDTSLVLTASFYISETSAYFFITLLFFLAINCHLLWIIIQKWDFLSIVDNTVLHLLACGHYTHTLTKQKGKGESESLYSKGMIMPSLSEGQDKTLLQPTKVDQDLLVSQPTDSIGVELCQIKHSYGKNAAFHQQRCLLLESRNCQNCWRSWKASDFFNCLHQKIDSTPPREKLTSQGRLLISV